MSDRNDARGPDRYLAGLEGGANVLVTGATPPALHREVCRRLCADDGGPRRRILVFAGRDAAVDHYLPTTAARDPEHLRVVDHGVPTRSAAAAGGARGGLETVNPMSVVEVPGDDLAALGATVSEAVDELDAVAGGLGPGDLRVCLDSLAALVETEGRNTVFGFLHLLTERLRRANALSVFHLPTEAGGETAGALAPLFDGVVEVRLGPDGGQFRFDLDGSEPSEWFGIDDETSRDG
jgi:hypothetical protein